VKNEPNYSWANKPAVSTGCSDRLVDCAENLVSLEYNEDLLANAMDTAL